MPSFRLEVVVASLDVLQSDFAVRTAHLAHQAIAARGRFSMAVPGGSLATALLPSLVGAPIDWSSTDIFWCDERAVPPEDPQSNFGATRAGWLGTSALREARAHPMPGGEADLVAAATAYAEQLRRTLGTPPAIDLVVLGVGEDGHVASLFPGAVALEERELWVAVVTDAPKPPPQRLTLTVPVLQHARVICIAAFGASKRQVMRSALDDPASDLPVAQVLRLATRAWVMLDPASAGTGAIGENA